MNDKLIVNGITLDLTDKVPVPVNFSIADLKDPSKRKRNFSKTITLMGTQNNLAFFAGSFGFTSTSNNIAYDATQKAPARYEKKGVPILTDALLKLNSVTLTKDNVYKFDCTLFSEAVDWFLLLDSLKVSDLDWTDYNHTLTRPNIKASWTALTGYGYYYALVERGLPRLATTTFSTTDLVPYVYQREVLIKILEWLEVDYESTFIETAFYKQMLFGYGGGIIKTITPAQVAERQTELNTGDTIISETRYPYLFNQFGNVRVFKDYGVKELFSDEYFTFNTVSDSLAQWDDGKLYIQYSGNYNLDLSVALDYQYNIGSYDFYNATGFDIFVHKNGLLLYQVRQSSVINWDVTGGATITANQNINRNITCESGDIITFKIKTGDVYLEDSTNLFQDNVSLDITTNGSITIDLTSTDTTITDGSVVNLGVFLPEMKCSDFLIGQVRQYNLQISDPDEDGKVIIEPSVGYYEDTDTFDDWTPILDKGKDVVIKPTANDYKKELSYKFKKVDDTDNKTYFEDFEHEYGDLKYTQGSYYAKGEEKVELPYGTIVPYEIAPSILVPRFIIIQDNGTVKAGKGIPRVMIRNGLKDGNWTFTNTINPTDPANRESLTSYPCVHHFDDYEDPSFDQNFKLVSKLFYNATTVTTLNSFSKYYYPSVNEMCNIDAKLLTAYFKLNPIDIRNLDFRRLKMLNGSLWRLNQVFDFDSDIQETTKVEMVKVLEAKSIRRKKTTFPHVVISYQNQNDDRTASPTGVGEDTPVVLGGNDNTLSNSEIIYG